MTGGTVSVAGNAALSATKLIVNTTGVLAYGTTPSFKWIQQFGSAIGTFDTLVVIDSKVLAVSGSDTYNLFDGSLTDVYGDAATFRLLVGYRFYIVSGGDKTGATIGNAGSNPHPLFFGAGAQTKTVYPGGPPDEGGTGATTTTGNGGVTVSTTAKNVLVTNNSAAVQVTYSLVLWGQKCVSGAFTGIPGQWLYP